MHISLEILSKISISTGCYQQAQTKLLTNQSEQRNVSGTVTLFCGWLGCVRFSVIRFEWEPGHTQFSKQMKHADQGNLESFPG